MASVMFYFLFIMRRQTMVIVLIFMPDYGLFQLMVHILSSFFTLLCNIHIGPFKNESLNWQERVNEIFIILSAYHLLVFTDYVPDDAVTDSGANIKDQFGWSMVACIIGNLLINIAIVLKEVV